MSDAFELSTARLEVTDHPSDAASRSRILFFKISAATDELRDVEIYLGNAAIMMDDIMMDDIEFVGEEFPELVPTS